MRIHGFSVAALVAVASTAPVDSTCTHEQGLVIQAAMSNCAEAAQHAAKEAKASSAFQSVFDTTSPQQISMVKTVFTNIHKQCAPVGGTNQAMVQFKCAPNNQGYCAPQLHEGKPKALADVKKGWVYLCPAFFAPTKKVAFANAHENRLSTNGLILINQLARIFSSPATQSFSPSQLGRFVQVITDEAHGTTLRTRTNPSKNLDRRARISTTTCARSQVETIESAQKECFNLVADIKRQAQVKDLAWFTNMVKKNFGDNSHLAVKSVTQTLASIQGECNSQDDSPKLRIECVSERLPHRCTSNDKAIADPSGAKLFLCPSFFAKNVHFGTSPTTVSLMTELVRIEKLRKTSISVSSLSNPANYASFLQDFMSHVTLKGDPPRGPAEKAQRKKVVHILGPPK